LQTTEGAMIEMTNMLQRMRELAIQSSNDTYTSVDRGYLDLEFQQLKAEVNRITDDTEWNGMGIMDGSVLNDDGVIGKFEFQVGANDGQIITHTIADMGFIADVGTAAFTTPTAATAGDKQVSKLTLSGTYLAGDVIEFKVGSNTKSYTVLPADLTGNNTANLASIAVKLRNLTSDNASTPTFTLGGTAVTVTANELTFTAATVNTPFTPTATNTPRGALQNISALNIQNNTNSNTSIRELDIAINRINTERAGIGAVINRLTYAVDNLANVSQNTSESRSRIMDADYAKASSELARTQIISQAATAMLAQANQQPQTVLQLLQG
jgi:flagellin